MSEQKLRETMGVQSTTYDTKEMDNFIHGRFEEISKGDESNFEFLYEKGNTYITKGKSKTYPCVVAHTDTVHDIHEDFSVFEKDGIMFAMDMTLGLQVGVGGDDKVGIYVALQMLERCEVIKVAFFRDEEHGCLGSREADMRWFDNVEFVFQCDRQKYKDFVRRIMGATLYDKAFSKAIGKTLKEYGKKEVDNGGLTDVYQLVENGLDVCVSNISCGYYRPHSDDEVIDVGQVFRTEELVFDLINKLKGKVWTNSEYRERGGYGYGYYGRWNGWDDYEDSHEAYYPVVGDKEDKKEKGTEGFFREEDLTDLETACPHCHTTTELMYDGGEDADWCFQCQDYVTHYDHYTKYFEKYQS